MSETAKKLLESRKERNKEKQGYKLVDALLEAAPTDSSLLDDAITYMIGGAHTTSNGM